MVHDNTINGIISWFHTRVKVHDLDTLMLPNMNQPLMLFNQARSTEVLCTIIWDWCTAEVQWVHTDVL